MKLRVLEMLGDDNEEAILEISSEEVSLVAFASPFRVPTKRGKLVLSAFLTENVLLEDTIQLPVKTDRSFFSYRITAQVIDTNDSKVCVGDIEIILDLPMPKDIVNGSVISFDVMRLDL